MGNSIPLVYLDNCCFNRPYDNQSQPRIELETRAKLFVQRLVVEKELSLVVSFMSEMENEANPFVERKHSIGDFFQFAVKMIPSTAEGEELAQEIVKGGLKTKDAAHLACAIVGGCDYFLTTDDRLLAYRDDRISIMNPTEFILLWRGGQQ